MDEIIYDEYTTAMMDRYKKLLSRLLLSGGGDYYGTHSTINKRALVSDDKALQISILLFPDYLILRSNPFPFYTAFHKSLTFTNK